ncbi:hypothetical protein [Burkholderia multivorans]|uniref:hypothetical protein n=1 Tax=Burkholderia multivorans TaxID=87883 RepID=UPI001C273302|nr:hypothetical protein [Burkholderia multivorans]MBU9337258.1 hypothetical protein [Burkholderia multivorans]MCA8480153.1 hypothetical protein [Burkholderia multivorans]
MNQTIIRACLLGAVAFAGAAQAAAPEPKSFEIKLRAEVSAVGGFEVKPVGWNLAEDQRLTWNEEKKAFDQLALNVNLKSGVGDVRVKFGNADEQHLTHESNAEAFYVLGAKVNGKAVGADAIAVITKEEAKEGKDVALLVTPGNASEAIKTAALAGKYTATLPLVFETVISE